MSMSYNNFCIKLLTCTHAGKSSIRCLRKLPKQERFEKTSLNYLGLNSLRNLQRFKLPYDKNGQLPIAAKGKITREQWKFNEKQAHCLKRRKAWVTKRQLVLIGWEGSASFLDKSLSRETQNQYNPKLLSTLSWKSLSSKLHKKPVLT